MTPLHRRQFLQCAAAGLMAAALGRPAEGAARGARKPNVILIFTDDQGSCDMPSYGASDLVLPHLESLVADGTRFTQFYAAAPVCSPSRAALLTGRYPMRSGVPDNVSSQPGNPGMPMEQVTIADTFKAAGYATAHIGKWHLGYTEDTMPNAQGFDHSFGHMGGCIDNYSHYFYWAGPNRHDLWRNGEEVYRPGEFFPDLMVEEANAFMEAHRDEPFFLYFASNAPHYPYQGDPKWIEHYNERGVPYPRNEYAAFLSSLDERIGALMAKVDDLGLRDDTIVVYMSDHGHSTEERAHFGGGSAGPYRGAKFSLLEGGIRVPAIIRWPGHVPAGAVRDQVAHGCDWLPTLASLCGVPLVENDIDGRSLVDIIGSPYAPSPHDTLYWTRQGGEEFAIRQGDWKLLGKARDTTYGPPGDVLAPLYLVNIAEDAGETTNLAEQHPEITARLEAKFREWLANAR